MRILIVRIFIATRLFRSFLVGKAGEGKIFMSSSNTKRDFKLNASKSFSALSSWQTKSKMEAAVPQRKSFVPKKISRQNKFDKRWDSRIDLRQKKKFSPTRKRKFTRWTPRRSRRRFDEVCKAKKKKRIRKTHA